MQVVGYQDDNLDDSSRWYPDDKSLFCTSVLRW